MDSAELERWGIKGPIRESRQWGRYYGGDNNAPYGPFTVPRLGCATGGAKAYVYFMRSGDLLKIGMSNNPAQRYREFQLANPAIELLGALKAPAELTRQVEMLLHARFVGCGSIKC